MTETLIKPMRASNTPEMQDVCQQINGISRQMIRMDVIIGRSRDALHRMTIARAALVVQRGDLLAALHVAEARAARPPGEPVRIIGPAANEPCPLLTDYRPRAVDADGTVPHLDREIDRSTSQIPAAEAEMDGEVP